MACTTEQSTAIGDLAAGRIDPDRALELFDHVEGCDACSEEWDLVAGLVATAERRGPGLFGPTGDQQTPSFTLLRGRRSWLSLAAAAAVLVAFGLWGARDWGTATPVTLATPATMGEPLQMARLAQLAPTLAPRSVLRSGTATTDEAYRAALELYAQGDFEGAQRGLAALLAELAGEAPQRPLVLLYFAIARLQGADPSGAEAALERAARTGSGLIAERARWYLANARLAGGDVDGALDAFRELEALAGDYELNARRQIEAIEAALAR